SPGRSHRRQAVGGGLWRDLYRRRRRNDLLFDVSHREAHSRRANFARRRAAGGRFAHGHRQRHRVVSGRGRYLRGFARTTGWGAEVLNGYEWLKDVVDGSALENYATGLGGYVASLARTVPKTMRQEPVHVIIKNTGKRAMQMDVAGNILKKFETGEVIFDGH